MRVKLGVPRILPRLFAPSSFPRMPDSRPSPELLAPAGSPAMMRSALAFGADAVYAGQPRYSLRVRNNEFGSLDALDKAISEAHGMGRKFYVVSNVLPHNAKVRTYLADMAPVVALRPDALIMADPGLIDIVRQAGAEPVGVGIVIEKGFQPGRSKIEAHGIRVESLAIIQSFDDNQVHFG